MPVCWTCTKPNVTHGHWPGSWWPQGLILAWTQHIWSLCALPQGEGRYGLCQWGNRCLHWWAECFAWNWGHWTSQPKLAVHRPGESHCQTGLELSCGECNQIFHLESEMEYMLSASPVTRHLHDIIHTVTTFPLRKVEKSLDKRAPMNCGHMVKMSLRVAMTHSPLSQCTWTCETKRSPLIVIEFAIMMKVWQRSNLWDWCLHSLTHTTHGCWPAHGLYVENNFLLKYALGVVKTLHILV